MALDGNLNISIIESDIKWCDKESNLIILEDKLAQIPRGTDIVILPELFTTGFITDDDNKIAELAEKNTENTISVLQVLAKKYSVAIAGSFIAKTTSNYYNRGFIIEPSQDETFYDKHHLFSMAQENTHYKAGQTIPPVLRYRGWNIMLVVCYDLRFPEWCRNVDLKYDLLIVVANWPKARKYPWQQLLIARAIENQAYVCGANRTGSDGYGIEYESSSMIVDYKGNTLNSNLQSDNVIISKTIDIKPLHLFREKFPAWKDADSFTII